MNNDIDKIETQYNEHPYPLPIDDMQERIAKINNVTKKSIEKVANKLLSSKPTISSIGPIKQLESLDKIQNRLN